MARTAIRRLVAVSILCAPLAGCASSGPTAAGDPRYNVMTMPGDARPLQLGAGDAYGWMLYEQRTEAIALEEPSGP